MPHHYFAIDGGSGAHLLAALSGYSPYLRPVSSPRHADMLIIVTPISQKLVPAIVEIAAALPRPARVLLIQESASELAVSSEMHVADTKTLFTDVRKITTSSVADVLHAIAESAPWGELALKDSTVQDAETIQLPSKYEQEVATELVVLSLGPIQPFTAGPLRVFLICDGEQVLSVQVESGYAQRGIAQAMAQADWQQSLRLARSFDPLAPIACQLAYVRAVEQMQSWQPSAHVVSWREAAVALERVENHLWWLVHFVRLLADAQLSDCSYQLATSYAACLAHLWGQPAITWIQPQWQSTIESDATAITQIKQLANQVDDLRKTVERNRWLMLRTRKFGALAASRLKEQGVNGPILQGSIQGAGDVQSRIVARLLNAVTDMRGAADIVESRVKATTRVTSTATDWVIPPGETHAMIEGPRGLIGLRLRSDGGEKPASIEWHSPSALLLPLLPEILAGQKLADAEIILASLDLAMAEADG